jgi:acid phosphatase (class A)
MRYGYLILLMGLAATPATAGLLDPTSFDAAKFLPPPPGETVSQAELSELRAITGSASAEHRAFAARDAKDETPDIFNGAIGFDVATTPQTHKLLQMVAEEEEGDTKAAKTFFHRERPYAVDPSLKTCTPIKPGKAATSYPSGHATLAFSMGIVLAQVLPSKSQAILARSKEYAENRLVCGVHYRSDIVAGQQFGTVLALRLMENAAFKSQMDLAMTELANH